MNGPEHYPPIHPRELEVSAAERSLDDFLIGWQARHSLTSTEYNAVLASALNKFGWRLVAIERRQSKPVTEEK